MDFHGFIDLYGIGSQFENSEITPELTKLIYMQFFMEVLEKYETDDNRAKGLMSIQTIKNVVLRRNWDVIPFYKYIQTKYSNQKILKEKKR